MGGLASTSKPHHIQNWRLDSMQMFLKGKGDHQHSERHHAHQQDKPRKDEDHQDKKSTQ